MADLPGLDSAMAIHSRELDKAKRAAAAGGFAE